MQVGEDVWEGVDDPQMVDRAVHIGHSINGNDIFWDVQGKGEYIIYVESDPNVRFGGKTLDEFISRRQTDEIKNIFGPGCQALPSLFEGEDWSFPEPLPIAVMEREKKRPFIRAHPN